MTTPSQDPPIPQGGRGVDVMTMTMAGGVGGGPGTWNIYTDINSMNSTYTYISYMHAYMFPKKNTVSNETLRFFNVGFNWNKSSHQTRGHFRQHPQVEPEPLPWRVAFQHLSRGSWRFWKKNGGFSPTNPWGFPTKNDDFGVWNGGYPPFLGKPQKWTSNSTGFEKKHVAFFDAAGDAPMDQLLYNQRRYNEGNCSYPLT